MRVPASLLLALAAGASAGCEPESLPGDNVISDEATLAAWTANGRVVYAVKVNGGPVEYAIRLYSPASDDTEEIAVVQGEPRWLDTDDTDRILLGGIGGAFTLLKQDGTLLHQVTALEDVSGGYESLHLSASGTLVALATLPPAPDLQVHSVTDGSRLHAYPDVAGTAVIRELEWSPDDSFLYYSVGDASGAEPDAIRRILAASPSAPALVFQDAGVPFVDRLFVSGDASLFVLSGEDAEERTGVWMLSAAGGTAVRVAIEDDRRLRVRAATGPSPDGEAYVLYSETARGTLLTVETLEAIE